MAPAAPTGQGPQRRRLLTKISDAIKQLGNVRGSSAKQIIQFLGSKMSSSKQVDEARVVHTLKRGVEAGILTARGGRYKLPVRDDDDRELACCRRRRRRSCKRRRRSCRRRRRSCRRRRRSCRRKRRRSCRRRRRSCRRRRRRSCRRRRRSCRRRRRRSCRRRRRRSCPRKRRRSCRRRRRRCSSDPEAVSLVSQEATADGAANVGNNQQPLHPSQQG